MYNLGEIKPGQVFNKAFKKCYQGMKGLQRLGSSMILADVNHDGKLDLVASSMNGKLEESGLVQVFLQ